MSWPRRTAGRRGTALSPAPSPVPQPPRARPARTSGWTRAGTIGHGRGTWLRTLRDYLLDEKQAGPRQGPVGWERAFGGSQIPESMDFAQKWGSKLQPLTPSGSSASPVAACPLLGLSGDQEAVCILREASQALVLVQKLSNDAQKRGAVWLTRPSSF